MTMSPIWNGFTFQDTDGFPLKGGKIYTYYAGSFSTKATTYQDPGNLIPNTNPLILDDNGRMTTEIWIKDNVSYNFVLTKSNGETVLMNCDDIKYAISDKQNPLIGEPIHTITGVLLGYTTPSMPYTSIPQDYVPLNVLMGYSFVGYAKREFDLRMTIPLTSITGAVFGYIFPDQLYEISTMQIGLSPVWNGFMFNQNDGNPLNGGSINTYKAFTSIDQPTYTTKSGKFAHTNPIILDSSGRMTNELWLINNTPYRLVLSDELGNEIMELDDVKYTPTGSTVPLIGSPLYALDGSLIGYDATSIPEPSLIQDYVPLNWVLNTGFSGWLNATNSFNMSQVIYDVSGQVLGYGFPA
jgi:hypothetical protein